MAEAHVVLKHRAQFDVYPLKEDGNAFEAVARVVVDWFVEKENCYDGSPIAKDFSRRDAFPLAWNYSMPDTYEGGCWHEDEWPALACRALKNDGGTVTRWIMEYDEPDSSHEDRRWHSVVCLDRNADGSCHVAMETICWPLGELAEPLPDTVAAPSLLKSIICLPWYSSKVGNTALQAVPNKLSVQTFEHFKEALVDPERKLPLVLFCTGYNGKVPEQAKQLARRALGLANIYILDWSIDELRAKEQALFVKGMPSGEYACPKSSCRMYMPGVDLSNHNASRTHESWNREALEAQRPSQFAESVARRLIANERVRGIAEINDVREAECSEE